MASHDHDLDEQDDEAFDRLPEDNDTTEPCPYCGASIYDDAEQCPACGSYLSQEDAVTRRQPWWVVATVAICILLVLSWVVGGLVSLFGFAA